MVQCGESSFYSFIFVAPRGDMRMRCVYVRALWAVHIGHEHGTCTFTRVDTYPHAGLHEHTSASAFLDIPCVSRGSIFTLCVATWYSMRIHKCTGAAAGSHVYTDAQ